MEALHNKTAVALIKTLMGHPFQAFKESELIVLAQTGKGSANIMIDLLVKQKLLQEQRVGRAKLLSLNYNNQAVFFLKNIIDQETLLEINKKILAAVLLLKNNINNNKEVLIMFGSQIAATAREKSDIDMLVASDNLKNIHRERAKVEEILGVRFNVHEYDINEFSKLKKDSFVRNAVYHGIILSGFDVVNKFLQQEKDDLGRIFFFIDRIKAARRNYLHKDYNTAKDILEKTTEQLIYYILSKKDISYTSKIDAKKAIKKTIEGRKLEKINKQNIKEKIDKLEEFILEILSQSILRSEGYE